MMKIYRPKVNFRKHITNFNKYLNDKNYNGYAYVIATIINGIVEVLRIGSTGRGSRGLNLYRVARNFREYKQADGKQTNMLGKYYSRNDCKIFFYPTKIPYEHTTIEALLKMKHLKKHGRIPRFDKDIQVKYLVSNDEWQK